MRIQPAIAVNRTAARLVSLLASITLGVLMVQHTATRKAEQRSTR
jgi:hypothetical protein